MGHRRTGDRTRSRGAARPDFIGTLPDPPQAGLDGSSGRVLSGSPVPAPSCTTSTRRPTLRRIRGRTPAVSPPITVSKVVERTFELARRRRPGKALVFIIDEVGQHVARSGDKIEDLRATVEEFGKVGKNLLKARKIDRTLLDRRHLAGEARRGGRRHRLEAGRTGEAPGPLPLPGRPRPLRHPGGGDEAGAGEEGRMRSRS